MTFSLALANISTAAESASLIIYALLLDLAVFICFRDTVWLEASILISVNTLLPAYLLDP